MSLKLYGTITSPYVRRIRILSNLLQLETTFIDTSTEDGQKELRNKTPLWKIPYVELGDLQIWDSHIITDHLTKVYGFADLRPRTESTELKESKLIAAIDQALDNGILLFYLSKEGVAPESVPYLRKNSLRVLSILDYLKKELQDNTFFSDDKRWGLSELALYTALDWMRFRAVVPVEEDPIWKGFLDHYGKHPVLAQTAPS